MATAPELKSSIQVLRSFKDSMSARTGITNFGTDSKARVLMDVFTSEVLDARQSAVDAFGASQLSTAQGEDLIQIGNTLGVPQFRRTFASSHRREHNFAFYVETGTFGDINSGANFTIPKGTLIVSDPNENELQAVVNYELTTDVTCLAAASLVYLSVRAKTSGSGGNVGPTVIRNHSFTGYTGSGAGSLKVINFFSVLNGREEESPRQYRYRLARNYDRLVSSNDSRIQLAGLRVPGVLDVKPISGYFGVGSVGVLVIGADFQSNQQLVRGVQEGLDQIFGPGSKAIAVGATKVQVDLVLQLRTSRSLTQSDKRNLETSIKRNLLNAVRSTPMGGTLPLTLLEQAVQQQGRGLLRFARALNKRPSLFKDVYLKRGFSNGISSERELLISSSVVLEEDEFIDLGVISFDYI